MRESRQESMRDDLRIGQVAERLGLNPKTIRYYEEIGLLPPAERSASGYRRYGAQDVERLGFIRRAKALGLSLDEIHDIISAQGTAEPPCAQVLAMVDNKTREIDERIQELETFRTELDALKADWVDENGRARQAPAQVCAIIERQTEVDTQREPPRVWERSTHRHEPRGVATGLAHPRMRSAALQDRKRGQV